MVILTLSFAVLGLCLLLFFLWRAHRSTRSRHFEIGKVDLTALRNLMAREEDAFLRTSLTPAHYRQVRRARVRASQEYLIAISQSCAAIIYLLRHRPKHSEQTGTIPIADLAKSVLRLRLTCLLFWCLFWAEYLLPNFDVGSVRLISRYERLLQTAQSVLQPILSDQALSLGQQPS